MFWVIVFITAVLWIVSVHQMLDDNPFVQRRSFACSALLFAATSAALIFETGFAVGQWVG